MGDDNINDILNSILKTSSTDNFNSCTSGSMGAKWDPASLQRLISDVLAMHQETYILKYRKNQTSRGIRVVFYVDRGSVWGETEPKEEEMVAVQDWCNKAKCGKRISFDTFYFSSEEAYLMFSLRWQ